MESDVYTETHIWIFIEILFIVAKKGETTQISIGWWMDKQRCSIHGEILWQ